MTTTPDTAITLMHVDYDDPRAAALRADMDAEMTARYTDPGGPGLSEAARAALALDPATIRCTVLALDHDGTPVGHAALRDLDGQLEVKRVVVAPGHRGRGIGRAVMTEVERVARAAGAERLVLQTGDRQPEAEALYLALGWTRIPTYPPYAGAVPQSRCFARSLG
jgi:GNAT superfamily N-acetyltransferase